jgi:hypothetical protein
VGLAMSVLQSRVIKYSACFSSVRLEISKITNCRWWELWHLVNYQNLMICKFYLWWLYGENRIGISMRILLVLSVVDHSYALGGQERDTLPWTLSSKRPSPRKQRRPLKCLQAIFKFWLLNTNLVLGHEI